jgi:hypothetical protein
MVLASLREEALVGERFAVQRLRKVHPRAAFTNQAARDGLREDDVGGSARGEDNAPPPKETDLLKYAGYDHRCTSS